MVILFYLAFITTALYIPCRGLLYEDIAQENLKSSIELNAPKISIPEATPEDERNYYEIYQDELKRQSQLSINTKRKLIFSVLADCEKTHKAPRAFVIDQKTCQDLELLAGAASSPQVYLGAKLARTQLEIGRVLFYKKLANPIGDYQKLLCEQAIIKELIRDTDLRSYCNTQLEKLKTAESIFLSLWDESDVFNTQLHYFTIQLPFTKNSQRIQKLSSNLNKNKYMLEINDKLNLFTTGMTNIMALAGAVILPVYGYTLIKKRSAQHHTHAQENLEQLISKMGLSTTVSTYTIPGAITRALTQVYRDPKYAQYVTGLTSVIAGLTLAKDAWLSRTELNDHVTFKKCLHTKVMHCAQLLETVQKLIARLTQNPLITSCWSTSELCALTAQTAEIKQLMHYLQDSTFKRPATTFSPAGIVFATYKLLLQSKQHLISVFVKLGEIDSYLSVAKLYIEYKNKPNSFCFPEFIEPKEIHGPCIQAVGFWNPALPGTAVSNSITLGKNHARSIVVTGPNEGGKSTIAAKGIPLTLLLAQSLGIAPAQALTCTPVSKICTCLRVTDNTALGNSYFKASVLRAREILDTVQALKPGEYALTSVDEIFNGTNFQDGQAAAHRFIELMGKNPYTMCIATTHFAQLTQLQEKTGLFENYKVSINEQAPAAQRYIYMLEPGISQQTVGLKILQEYGFGTFTAN